MLAWPFPLFLLVVWSLWIMACVAPVGAQEIRLGTPQDARRGVSIVPAFPFFPFFFWTFAAFIDHCFLPWGTRFIGGFHAIFALILLASIIKDWRFCRSYNSSAER